MISTHLANNTRVIRTRPRFLRHLNAGTLSIVMMVGLALLDAMRGPNSTAATSVLDKTVMTGMATNVSSPELDTAIHASGFCRLDQRATIGPCSSLHTLLR